MSLFSTSPTFADAPQHLALAKVGLLVGSAFAGVIATMLLMTHGRPSGAAARVTTHVDGGTTDV